MLTLILIGAGSLAQRSTTRGWRESTKLLALVEVVFISRRLFFVFVFVFSGQFFY